MVEVPNKQVIQNKYLGKRYSNKKNKKSNIRLDLYLKIEDGLKELPETFK